MSGRSFVGMPSTHPIGPSQRVNHALLGATLAFAMAATATLCVVAPHPPSLVYGLTMLASALFSFLYHTTKRPTRRRLLRLLDHAAIFLLIAGTYTPFAAVALKGWGASLLVIVWSLAGLGILLKILLSPDWDRVFVWVYIALGWAFVIGLDEALTALSGPALALLAAGGLAYTIGAIIYWRDIGEWTDPVWHGFVLAGKGAHFAAVLAIVAS